MQYVVMNSNFEFLKIEGRDAGWMNHGWASYMCEATQFGCEQDAWFAVYDIYGQNYSMEYLVVVAVHVEAMILSDRAKERQATAMSHYNKGGSNDPSPKAG
jgi:hypothetical protein